MTTEISIGGDFPDIAMMAVDGSPLRPSDYKGQKLVVFFYPKDNTPGCTSEAKDFSALKAEFDAANCAILGVSKDSPKKHMNFIAKHGLTVTLATDAEENGLSDALGVWGEKKMYGVTFTGMIRSTYLIDADGKVARIWAKVKVKGHAAEVLEAVKAL